MRKILLFLVVFAVTVGSFSIKTDANAPIAEQQTVIRKQPVIIQRKAPETVEELIADAALRYGINHDEFLAVATCESNLNILAIGDQNSSFGLFQINLPSHPEVTKEQALDPVWAVEWSAKKFKKNPRIWTCYNMFF